MNVIRMEEITNAILADLAGMGVGPDQNVPVRTIWLRALNQWEGKEFEAALAWGVGAKLWRNTPGGIAGLGNLTLTDVGYALSRA